MMRLGLVLLTVVLLTAPQAVVAEEQFGSSMIGPGAVITPNPPILADVNGLALIISEPNASDEPWAAIVINRSDQAQGHIRVKFEIEIDGQWYIPDIPGEAYVYPVVLQPGEFGIATLGELGHGSEDWDQARVTSSFVDPSEPAYGLVDLAILELATNGSHFVGSVQNNSSVSVGEVGIRLSCITSDGIVKRESFGSVDIRRLDPGESTEFDFVPFQDDLCPDGSELAASADGVDRAVL